MRTAAPSMTSRMSRATSAKEGQPSRSSIEMPWTACAPGLIGQDGRIRHTWVPPAPPAPSRPNCTHELDDLIANPVRPGGLDVEDHDVPVRS